MTQLSLFAAEQQPPAVGDLEGALAGPAQLASAGELARLSLRAAPWRAGVLVAELTALLGVPAETVPGPVVRTPFLAVLRPMARSWVRGAAKCPPAGWALGPRRLRWWCLAAGQGYEPDGYTLGLGAGDELVWPVVGAALAGIGLAATFVGPRADGPAYRVTGRRRMRRLAETVGAPPQGMPAEHWPQT